MIQTFKSSTGFSNTYVICRFSECIIINPSHSYEEIISYIDNKKIVGIFITEPSNITLDQIGYYNSKIYVTPSQFESFNNNQIEGYDYKNKPPFNIENLKLTLLNLEEEFMFADIKIKSYEINGARKVLACHLISNNLFTGSLFLNDKIIKKDKYKSAIYDLRRSVQNMISDLKNPIIYPLIGKERLLSTEVLLNEDLQKWA